MDFDKKITELKPSKENLSALLDQTVHLDIKEMSEDDVEIFSHISASVALFIACLKDHVSVDADRKFIVYKGKKPTLKQIAFVRALCRMAEPVIGKLSSLRLMEELA